MRTFLKFINLRPEALTIPEKTYITEVRIFTTMFFWNFLLRWYKKKI
jgi:hypothetical protein